MLFLLPLLLCALHTMGYSPSSAAVDNALRAMTAESVDDKDDVLQLPAIKSKHLANRYMMDMYSRQSSHQQAMPFEANIVRSIVPDLGALPVTHAAPVDSQVHFVIDRPSAAERIVGAVLHMKSGHRLRRRDGLNAMRRRRRNLYVTAVNPSFGLIAPSPHHDHEDLTDDLKYDFLPVVTRALRNTTQNKMQLSLVLSRFQRKSGAQRDLSAKKVHRRHAPFLLLYFKSDGLMHMDSDEENSSPKTAADVPHSRSRRSIVDPKYFLYHFKGQTEDHTATTTTRAPVTAKPRAAIMNARAYLSQGPELFHDRKEMKANRRKNKIISRSTVHREVCQKHRLSIKFDEIGWKHTIIAPRELNADYCGGGCEFPLKRASAPSNHALLQSMLHHVGEPNIPAVCCAPSKMDSLTLLFFDRRENIVLKTFPKMLVEACGCM